ncbi:LOW QUALITY PROTEIN: hypothetical protein V2J09_012510 [Rumex salicifolius]
MGSYLNPPSRQITPHCSISLQVFFSTQLLMTNLPLSTVAITRLTSKKTRCRVLEHETNAKLEWLESSSFFKNYFYGEVCIAASLDGLLLITAIDLVKLWNPSIRKAHEIPKPTGNGFDTRLGLGYEESCDDYKILAVMDHFYPPNETSKRRYIVLETRPGRRLSCPPLSIRRMVSMLSRGLLWVEGVDTGNNYYHQLARFDFATEKFRYSPVPYPIRENLWITSRIVMVDGRSSLGVFGVDNNFISTLWITDANATDFSWTKVSNFGEGVKQMRCFANKEIVWEYWTKCARLKPSVYADECPYDSRVAFVDAYVESLVLLK